MSQSQNLAFTRPTDSTDEPDHPKGESIARLLEKRLIGTDWQPKRLDVWRDIGWDIEVAKKDSKIDIRLAAHHDHLDAWMLQITPTFLPSFMSRLFKRIQNKPAPSPSATHNDMFELAKLIHNILNEHGFDKLRWSFSDPYSESTTTTPILFQEA